MGHLAFTKKKDATRNAPEIDLVSSLTTLIDWSAKPLPGQECQKLLANIIGEIKTDLTLETTTDQQDQFLQALECWGSLSAKKKTQID